MKTKNTKQHITLIALVGLFASITTLPANNAVHDSSVISKKEIKPYLLKNCIVSNEELGSMGDYIRFIYKGQEVKVCCKPCIKKFKKTPKKFLKILAEETSKLKKKK